MSLLKSDAVKKKVKSMLLLPKIYLFFSLVNILWNYLDHQQNYSFKNGPSYCIDVSVSNCRIFCSFSYRFNVILWLSKFHLLVACTSVHPSVRPSFFFQFYVACTFFHNYFYFPLHSTGLWCHIICAKSFNTSTPPLPPPPMSRAIAPNHSILPLLLPLRLSGQLRCSPWVGSSGQRLAFRWPQNVLRRRQSLWRHRSGKRRILQERLYLHFLV